MYVNFEDFDVDKSSSWANELRAPTKMMNQWLKENTVRVINIETLINVYGGGGAQTKVLGVRVWYSAKYRHVHSEDFRKTKQYGCRSRCMTTTQNITDTQVDQDISFLRRIWLRCLKPAPQT